MKLLKNRKFAAAVLIVCILGSIFGMGGGSLAAQRREAVRVFNEGIDTSFAVRFSMDAYLDQCAEYARLMAEETKLRVDANSEEADEVLALAAQIGDGEDLNARYTAYTRLCAEVESLFTCFQSAEMPEEDRHSFEDAYANYQGEISKLNYDEYHPMAEKFNRNLQGFPANVAAKLWGVAPLHPFR